MTTASMTKPQTNNKPQLPQRQKGSKRKKPARRNEREQVFALYVAMGNERNLVKLAEKTQIAYATLTKWSMMDKWNTRVREIEQGIYDRIVEEQVKELTPSIKLAAAIRKKALTNTLKRLTSNGERTKQLDNKLAWEMARTEQGLPTKVSKVTAAVTKPLSIEDIERVNQGNIAIVDELTDQNDYDDDDENPAT